MRLNSTTTQEGVWALSVKRGLQRCGKGVVLRPDLGMEVLLEGVSGGCPLAWVWPFCSQQCHGSVMASDESSEDELCQDLQNTCKKQPPEELDSKEEELVKSKKEHGRTKPCKRSRSRGSDSAGN